jgi:hypothetical protein
MALQKIQQFNNGTEATYWKITGIMVNTIQKKAVVTVTGYLSKEVRDEFPNGKITEKEFIISIENPAGNVIEQAYEALKTTKENKFETEPFFADAETI